MSFGNKICVYTVSTGSYESLPDQSVSSDEGIPFICFSDKKEDNQKTWNVVNLKKIFMKDDIRDQRRVKILTNEFLKEFDISIYIDKGIILKKKPEDIIREINLESGICLPWHSHRKTLKDEFDAVKKEKLDDPNRVSEQLDHYKILFPDELNKKPLWSAIMIRDNRNKKISEAMNIWYSHVLRYSRRDQLSLSISLNMAGVSPNIMKIDNFSSHYHSWINISDRKKTSRHWS